MNTILMQERLLGGTLGVLFGLGVFIYEEKQLWRSTAKLADTLSGGRLPPSRPVEVPEPIFGQQARARMGHQWNVGVDRTLGSLVAVLGSKGW